MKMVHKVALAIALAGSLSACSLPDIPTSSSGVGKATVKVPTGSDGLTTEQRNVGGRVVADNKPGAIKYLYVISPYSGQVIIYSTVKGKVTSSGKRLAPKTVSNVIDTDGSTLWSGFLVLFGNTRALTQEVLEDDGTYGNSVEYIYWWDAQGIYHQHFFTGGQIIHVADQPISVKSVMINMETRAAPQ